MLHFIYNPTAGRGRCERARRALEPLLDEAGREYRFHPTSAKGDAGCIAGELTAGEIDDQDRTLHFSFRVQEPSGAEDLPLYPGNVLQVAGPGRHPLLEVPEA